MPNIAAIAIILFAQCALSASASDAQPPGVRINEVGFKPSDAKIAVVQTTAARPIQWRLIDAQGVPAATGQTAPRGMSRQAGEAVHQIDFSEVRSSGEGFVIEAGGVQSAPFSIDENVYARLAIDALRFYFHQRSGASIEAAYAGEVFARPAGHAPDLGRCVSRDNLGNDWGGCPYIVDATGGWYDAGDHGKYVVNGGISVWTLINLYERLGDAAIADGAAGIPESGNGVADLLDEARIGLDFLLAMQVPEGTHLMLPLGVQTEPEALRFTRVDASGMAHHKIHDSEWTPLPTAPHKDAMQRVVAPPSTAATLNLAAAAAQGARVFRATDEAYAQRLLDAARRAYAAARRTPDALAREVTAGGGGAYGDDYLQDEFYWAATELYLATGERGFENDMRSSALFLAAPGDAGAGDISWNATAPLATLSLAFSEAAGNDLRQRSRAALARAAERFVAEAASDGYGAPFVRSHVWGSNADLANRGLVLAAAYDATGDPRYRASVVAIADILLGRNPLGRSYVSGYGSRPMKKPHHRFFARSLDPAYPPPPPGFLAGGPNKDSPGEDIARALANTCAPQKCWLDDPHAYSLNEVAINWNAPLVWIAAWLDHGD